MDTPIDKLAALTPENREKLDRFTNTRVTKERSNPENWLLSKDWEAMRNIDDRIYRDVLAELDRLLATQTPEPVAWSEDDQAELVRRVGEEAVDLYSNGYIDVINSSDIDKIRAAIIAERPPVTTEQRAGRWVPRDSTKVFWYIDTAGKVDAAYNNTGNQYLIEAGNYYETPQLAQHAAKLQRVRAEADRLCYEIIGYELPDGASYQFSQRDGRVEFMHMARTYNPWRFDASTQALEFRARLEAACGEDALFWLLTGRAPQPEPQP